MLYADEKLRLRTVSDLLEFKQLSPPLLHPAFQPLEARFSAALFKDHLLSPSIFCGVSREGPFVQSGARVLPKSQHPPEAGKVAAAAIRKRTFETR